MNKRKYMNSYYTMREITDLKDLVDSSAKLFSKKTAYYMKRTLGGEYLPISYNRFKADVDALGTALWEMGLAGEKIAIIGENSYEWVVAYCAVVCGTGVAVPLDRELHPKEIGNLIARSGAEAVIHSKKLAKVVDEALADISAEITVMEMSRFPAWIEEGESLIGGGDRRFLDAEVNPDDLCAILFTSGTTGLAKGVMLSHRNIAANVYNLSKYVKISQEGIGLSVLPMHHSYEMTCHIFTAMYQGISVAICEGLKYIAKNMAEIRATVMLGVPLVFESMHKKIFKQAEASGKLEKLKKGMALSRKWRLYNHPAIVKRMFGDIHTVTGGCIEMFIAGGAAINPQVIEDFEAMGFPMFQGYGMTENAPLIAVNRDRCSKAASVGRAIPGTEICIEDPDETGMGEILCKGSSVMMGYYDNPEETAKVLQNGWLRTGDYGRLDEDGFLYISGRKKNVIVTKNGKNIFPEEVEFYLTERKYIEEVLVHGVYDEKTGDTVIKAEIFPDYPLIAEEEGDLEPEALYQVIRGEIDAANELMPLYKRVKRFDIRKTEFDKTTTRKIKRYTEGNLCEEG